MSVALKFDDKLDPTWTARVLAALATAGARATFLAMGAAERWPEAVRATVDVRHDVQRHCHAEIRAAGLKTGLAPAAGRSSFEPPEPTPAPAVGRSNFEQPFEVRTAIRHSAADREVRPC